MSRPFPSKEILNAIGDTYAPAYEVAEWARDTFLKQNSPLYNPESDHLNSAHVGFLWTNVPLIVNQQRKMGRAKIPQIQGSKWDKGIYESQLITWFGTVPNFLITLDALLCNEASDRQFCRITDHEYLHCGQRMKYGFPVFDKKTNKPKFAMRGHDREVFDSEIRRWGARAVLGEAVDIILAANNAPEIPDDDIVSLCGTCALM